jgi:methylated-DNA-[protein]-cysteine S-methyltransferase
MEKSYFNGILCFESEEKICKITVVLTRENLFERIILTPLGENLPHENDSKPLRGSFAAKIIENCFCGFDGGIQHLPFAKTYFGRVVFENLRRVPYATTISYKNFAALCGNPNAARAIGNALKNNPLPIIYPCHRVVATNGIGGFCGSDKKYIEIKEKFLFAEKNGKKIAVL